MLSRSEVKGQGQMYECHNSGGTACLTVRCRAWVPAGFFPGVGKLGGLDTKVPQWGPGMECG